MLHPAQWRIGYETRKGHRRRWKRSQASGSCRDIAALFIAAARHLGFGARAVSGYLLTRKRMPTIPVEHMPWGKSTFQGRDGSPSNARALRHHFSIFCCTAANRTHIKCRLRDRQGTARNPHAAAEIAFWRLPKPLPFRKKKDDNNKATLPDEPYQSQRAIC